jgi:HSP90 family molecular chaperone
MVQAQKHTFKAETQQLLQILIHSLYAQREVFLRELISNAADAITRFNYEQLTRSEVRDSDQDPGIWLTVDKDAKTLTIKDNGIGMTSDEINENLGTIGHSGIKAFLEAVNKSGANLQDVIGQFGVGFYSAFMVAEEIEIDSCSYLPEAEPVNWRSDGVADYEMGPSEKTSRGTEIVLHLNEQSEEFLDEHRLRNIIKKHSNFIPYPIYVGEEEEPVNEQTALWRKPVQEVEQEQYDDFYRQFTLDFQEPLTHLHLNIDAPVQMYALLYVPQQPERSMFSPRQVEGLELFARKVLIQEYTLDLLPRAFRFMQGIIDSEDIPLNVSRETIQSSRLIRQIKKVVTGRLISHLEEIQTKEPDKYAQFWKAFGQFIKEGIASDEENYEKLEPLLVFHSIKHPDEWISLQQYIDEMQEGQEKIYFLLGEDESSLRSSPHLEVVEDQNVDVLLMDHPVDPFMLLRMKTFNEKPLSNLALESQAQTKPQKNPDNPEQYIIPHDAIRNRFKEVLEGKVADVRITDHLTRSPARLVTAEGAMSPEMQRVYEYINREHETNPMVLEINPNHTLIKSLESLDEGDERFSIIATQIYENLLLLEGSHPDPASMVERIQQLMMRSLEN